MWIKQDFWIIQTVFLEQQMRIFATAAPGDLGNPMRRICLRRIIAKAAILKKCFLSWILQRQKILRYISINMM